MNKCRNQIGLSLILSLIFLSFSCVKGDNESEPFKWDSTVISLSSNYLAIGEHLIVSLDNRISPPNIKWDFGDGSVSSKREASHQYDQEGVFTITLSVNNQSIQRHVKVKGGGITQRTKELLLSDEVTIMAHRGNTGDMTITENSINAVEECVKSGKIDFVEIDLRLTKDNEIVIMHDDKIDRTTTGSGKVSELTLNEIKSYNLLDRLGNETSEKVPTLEEILLVGRGDIFFNFDLGGRTDISVSKLYNILKKTGMLDRVLIYTATKSNYGNQFLSINPYLHVYPYYNNPSTASFLNTYIDEYNRHFFGQMDARLIFETSNISSMKDKDIMSSINMFPYDSEIKSGDFSGVQKVLNGADGYISNMQTDYPYELFGYLKSIGRK